jgi:hypothetical protein
VSRRRQTPADEEHYLIRSLAAVGTAGRSIRRHSHAWHQLIYASRGVMTVWTERGSWIAPPDWAIWAPAGAAHAIRFTGTTDIRTLYLRPELRALPERCGVVRVSALLRELTLRTVELGMLDRREPIHTAMAELIIHELCASDTPPLELPMPEDPQLRQLAESPRTPGTRAPARSWPLSAPRSIPLRRDTSSTERRRL